MALMLIGITGHVSVYNVGTAYTGSDSEGVCALLFKYGSQDI